MKNRRCLTNRNEFPKLIIGFIADCLHHFSAMSVGLLAFALLIPLALTSTNGWQRRLGRRWKVLHRLVYIAVPLSILHYLWLERDIKDWVWLYASLAAILFVIRYPAIRQAIVRKRQHRQMILNENSD